MDGSQRRSNNVSKRRKRHRQARAGGGNSEDEEAGKQGGNGFENAKERGEGVQGDGVAPSACEGMNGGVNLNSNLNHGSGGLQGLGVISPRRPGARERAREARRRQRAAEALQEAREAQVRLFCSYR